MTNQLDKQQIELVNELEKKRIIEDDVIRFTDIISKALIKKPLINKKGVFETKDLYDIEIDNSIYSFGYKPKFTRRKFLGDDKVYFQVYLYSHSVNKGIEDRAKWKSRDASFPKVKDISLEEHIRIGVNALVRNILGAGPPIEEVEEVSPTKLIYNKESLRK